MNALNNTSRVILGLLHYGEHTGYELKAIVDDSTQFFWAASYGRIYPELHRLEDQCLITSREEPRGGRPRRLYALTEEGEAAFMAWLCSPTELTFELRDEGFLRFFFADVVAPETARANLAAMRDRHQGIADRLRELEPLVRDEGRAFALLTLRGGIELHTSFAEWCRRTEQEALGEG